MDNKEDLLFIKEILLPYKFLELCYQNFFPKQKYDLIIANKNSFSQKKMTKIDTAMILVNCLKEERKENIFMCKAINKNAIDFIMEIHEKEDYPKITIRRKYKHKYKFAEEILTQRKKLFFDIDYESNKKYFQSFKNKKLLEVVEYLHNIKVEIFICQFKKDQIIFILDYPIDTFIVNNYFENIKVRNKKYRLFFKL